MILEAAPSLGRLRKYPTRLAYIYGDIRLDWRIFTEVVEVVDDLDIVYTRLCIEKN